MFECVVNPSFPFFWGGAVSGLTPVGLCKSFKEGEHCSYTSHIIEADGLSIKPRKLFYGEERIEWDVFPDNALGIGIISWPNKKAENKRAMVNFIFSLTSVALKTFMDFS